MSFDFDTRVRFRHDPEGEVFRVAGCDSGSCDLVSEGGRLFLSNIPILSNIPTRLLERVPHPVRIGDLFRGRFSGVRYVVVDERAGGEFLLFARDLEDGDNLAVFSETVIHNPDLFEPLSKE